MLIANNWITLLIGLTIVTALTKWVFHINLPTSNSNISVTTTAKISGKVFCNFEVFPSWVKDSTPGMILVKKFSKKW